MGKISLQICENVNWVCFLQNFYQMSGDPAVDLNALESLPSTKLDFSFALDTGRYKLGFFSAKLVPD